MILPLAEKFRNYLKHNILAKVDIQLLQVKRPLLSIPSLAKFRNVGISMIFHQRVRAEIRTAGGFGRSEAAGLVFHNQFTQTGSLGKPIEILEYKLVDPETMKDISEPNVNGELFLRGQTVFKGYYKCPEATAETFVEGWFRSGDIFYRDDDGNFFFVERRKSQLKYKNYQISLKKLEAVVKQHPGVMDVEVARLPDLEFGEIPIVFIKTRSNKEITAKEVKNVVENTRDNELFFRRQFNSFPGEY